MLASLSLEPFCSLAPADLLGLAPNYFCDIATVLAGKVPPAASRDNQSDRRRITANIRLTRAQADTPMMQQCYNPLCLLLKLLLQPRSGADTSSEHQEEDEELCRQLRLWVTSCDVDLGSGCVDNGSPFHVLSIYGGPLAERILQTLLEVEKKRQLKQAKNASAAARSIDLLRDGNQSALSLAIDNGHVGVCLQLLHAGARCNPNGLLSKHGSTAAKRGKWIDVVALLHAQSHANSDEADSLSVEGIFNAAPFGVRVQLSASDEPWPAELRALVDFTLPAPGTSRWTEIYEQLKVLNKKSRLSAPASIQVGSSVTVLASSHSSRKTRRGVVTAVSGGVVTVVFSGAAAASSTARAAEPESEILPAGDLVPDDWSQSSLNEGVAMTRFPDYFDNGTELVASICDCISRTQQQQQQSVCVIHPCLLIVAAHYFHAKGEKAQVNSLLSAFRSHQKLATLHPCDQQLVQSMETMELQRFSENVFLPVGPPPLKKINSDSILDLDTEEQKFVKSLPREQQEPIHELFNNFVGLPDVKALAIDLYRRANDRVYLETTCGIKFTFKANTFNFVFVGNPGATMQLY